MAKPWVEIGRYGGVGIELVLTILALGGLGNWLDRRYWGGAGWGTAIGFVLGVAVAFRNLMRTTAHMQRDIERAEARDPAANRWTVDESWVHREVGGEPVAADRDRDHRESGDDDDGPRRA